MQGYGYGAPEPSYGAPEPSYGAPSDGYGAPARNSWSSAGEYRSVSQDIFFSVDIFNVFSIFTVLLKQSVSALVSPPGSWLTFPSHDNGPGSGPPPGLLLPGNWTWVYNTEKRGEREVGVSVPL